MSNGKRGGQPGNQNGAKAKIWWEAISRVLESRQPRREQYKVIDELAEQLIDKCYEGDLAALKELGDRLDGKPHQSVGGGTTSSENEHGEIVIRSVNAND